MTKTFDYVERPRRGPAPNDGAVAAKLLVKTPWNAWLDDDICGALDWPELLALLLRDLPVAPVAPLLSHAMKRLRHVSVSGAPIRASVSPT